MTSQDATAAEWKVQWERLRLRRIVAMLTVLAFVPVWVVWGATGLLASFAALVAAWLWLRHWRCPGCSAPFVGAGSSSFPDGCAWCGLPVFASHPPSPECSDAPLRASVLAPRLRRMVAGSEIVGGAGAMLLAAFHAEQFRGVLLILLEGLGGLSIAAGYWLWRDEEKGYALTRHLQIVQLVRIQSSWVLYAATAGFTINLRHMPTLVQISPGFRTEFNLIVGNAGQFGVGVNLWAAFVLFVLSTSRPAAAFHSVATTNGSLPVRSSSHAGPAV